MRSLLFFIAFLMAGTLSGQIYSQNEAPVQQAKIPTDCYTLNVDMGNAALMLKRPCAFSKLLKTVRMLKRIRAGFLNWKTGLPERKCN
jgi:hypothetical protein